MTAKSPKPSGTSDRMNILYAFGSISPTSIPSEWADALVRRGHRVTVVPLAGECLKGGFAGRLHRTVRRLRPDVVHLHHTRPAFIGSMVASTCGGIPSVLTVHRLMSDMDRPAWWAHVLAGFQVEAIVANSAATLESFPAVLRNRARCEIIHNGVDLGRIQRARALTPSEGARPVRVVSVGRLIREKGFEILLDAVREVLNRGCRLAVTIIGDGPERARLQQLAESLGLRGIVEFTGAIPRSAVYERLAEADIFVLCSRTEGFCNAVVEAMATGLPILVTPGGALSEVVGDTGYLAQDHSVSAVASGLQKLVRMEPGERREMGVAAALRAQRFFSMDRVLDQYERLYSQVKAAKHYA